MAINIFQEIYGFFKHYWPVLMISVMLIQIISQMWKTGGYIPLLFFMICLLISYGDSQKTVFPVFRMATWVVLLAALLFYVFNPILVAWKLRSGGYFTMGGLVPYSDANAYLTGAKRLIEFGHLDEWCSRRPIPTGFIAVLMKICHQNIQHVLLLQAFFALAAIWFATLEIRRSFGFSGALVFIITTCAFWKEFAPTLMTEPTGFTLGAIAFTCLCRAFINKNTLFFLCGMFVSGLALSARAGAFLVLPLLMLYGLACFHSSRTGTLRLTVQSLTVMILSQVISPLMLTMIGADQFSYQGNLGENLYGLIRGGSSWELVYKEHPDLTQLNSITEISRRIYQYCWEAFQHDPLLVLQATGMQYYKNTIHLFDFLFRQLQFGFYYKLLLVPFWVAVLWLITAVCKLQGIGFIPVGVIGIILSTPFMIGLGIRVYAATIIYHAAIAGIGAGLLLGNRPISCADEFHDWRRDIFIWFQITVIGLAVIGPIILHLIACDPPVSKTAICNENEKRVVFRFVNGSGFIVGDPKTDYSGKYIIRKAHLMAERGIQILQAQPYLQPGSYFSSILNLADPGMGYAYLIIPNFKLPRQELISVCAKPVFIRPHKETLFLATEMTEEIYHSFSDVDLGCVTGLGWPQAYSLPAAFPKSLSEKQYTLERIDLEVKP